MLFGIFLHRGSHHGKCAQADKVLLYNVGHFIVRFDDMDNIHLLLHLFAESVSTKSRTDERKAIFEGHLCCIGGKTPYCKYSITVLVLNLILFCFFFPKMHYLHV